jgi:hypothetical protein
LQKADTCIELIFDKKIAVKTHLHLASVIFCATLTFSAQIPTNRLVSKWSFNGDLTQITIYPNPTSSLLNITVKEQTQIFITNLLGKVLKKENVDGSSQIDVSEFGAGLCFINDASSSAMAITFIKE